MKSTINKIYTAIIVTAIIVGSGVFFLQQQVHKIGVSVPVNVGKKTYSSKAYGLSFEYPSNWKVSEDVERLDASPPEPAQWSNYFTVDTLKEPYVYKQNAGDQLLTIDGEKAYLVDPNPLNTNELLYVRFSHNGRWQQVYFFKQWYKEMPVIKEMLQSIRFIKN